MSVSAAKNRSSGRSMSGNGRSVFRRAFDGLVSARAREAKRQVNSVLLGMDDATLHELGYSREELLREGSTTQSLF